MWVKLSQVYGLLKICAVSSIILFVVNQLDQTLSGLIWLFVYSTDLGIKSCISSFKRLDADANSTENGELKRLGARS